MHEPEPRPEVSPKLRVDALIARGAFGQVFRARQLAVARDVAVKVLHAELMPDSEPGRLFRDEIRAIGTIDHRNVVRIFDADETRDGRLYFVMELLEGPTLQQLADAGPVPVARARQLVAQLLDGLAAVHASGHIHADVKPSNAIVTGGERDERVVLVDFGLSRLGLADRPTEAVGGTRAYMAPEQLRTWSVDARSDVFSAALVFVKLVTGTHRAGDELAPPTDAIADLALRAAIDRALAEDPAQRPTAAELARALRGGELVASGGAPFRALAPFTEDDRGRLYGRDADVARLVRRIETSALVVLTAPSGTGKTSLLRAGLTAELDARGVAHRYLACEPGMLDALALDDPPPRVAVIDQVEVALAAGDAGVARIAALVGMAAPGRTSLVLGVREDFVARLINVSPALADGVPQLRLGPIDRAGARVALVEPLAERGIAIEPALLEQLLDDLVHAGVQLDLPSGSVYPPHLQLVGAVLFDALAPGERHIGAGHYRRVGGFEGVVGGYLERTLGELADVDREIARALFLELVGDAQTRTMRAEHDLVDAVGARYGEIGVHRVLERLAARRLITRSSAIDGVASWELVHDTLVPRIAAWLTVQDLDRRRVAEIVRFHVRQSIGGTPALLTRAQLGELDRFPGLLEALDDEHVRRSKTVWTPRQLVERSREVQRYRRGLATGAAIAIAAVTALLVGSWLHERRLREQVSVHRDLNIGRIDLSIEPFDLRFDGASHAVARVAVPPGALPELAWSLYDPGELDREAPGAPLASPRVHRGTRTALAETGIEVRGGDAFLVVTGRGRPGERCAPSIVPLKHLPGNEHYMTPRPIHVLVPTCAASRFDTIEIPAGPFVAGGLGVPPAHFTVDRLAPERVVDLPAFAIDRTEITNGAFAIFTELSDVHDIVAPEYGGDLDQASGPAYPRGGIDWFDARAYCRFFGKDLPTSLQWQKALRGGLTIAGAPNPAPRRNFPWGESASPITQLARIADASVPGDPTLGHANDARRPAAAGSVPGDRSPYGVADLAGNVQEWTLDLERGSPAPLSRRPRYTRGGNWWDTAAEALVDYMAIENPRSPTMTRPFIGARCALTPP